MTYRYFYVDLTKVDQDILTAVGQAGQTMEDLVDNGLLDEAQVL